MNQPQQPKDPPASGAPSDANPGGNAPDGVPHDGMHEGTSPKGRPGDDRQETEIGPLRQ